MMKRIYPLFFIIIFLSGCVEQEITLDRDNVSGVVKYRINFKYIFDKFISYQNKLENFDLSQNIIFDKGRLEESLLMSKKLTLLSYNRSDYENGIIYDVNLRFEEIEASDKMIKPLFLQNKIFKENKVVYCQTKIGLTNFGNPEKIKAGFSSLGVEEKNILEAYLSLVKIKVVYITPFPILAGAKDPGNFFVVINDNIPATIFEQEIMLKLLKKEDRDVFNTLYIKDKLKNVYVFRKKITEDNIKVMQNILISVGYRNKVVYEYSALDLLRSKEDIKLNINYKTY